MKKKLVSVGLALVLALSLSLVGAIPALAQQELNVYSYGSHLYVDDGPTEWSEISIPTHIAIEDITELTFRQLIESYDPNGWDVSVVLGIDCDGDGFEADIAGWHQTHSPAALGDDTFVSMESPTGQNPTTGVWTEIDALAAYKCWTPNVAGDGFDSFYGAFGDFVAGLPLGRVEIGDNVTAVKLQIGGSGSWMDETAYVDEATVNGETYYLTIQRAIDSVTGTTINVAAGTYNEAVTVDKSLTLLGANADVCAGVNPGTRGPEAVIDGRIDIQASNVVIDGIKLINGLDSLGEHVGIYMINQSDISIKNSILVGPVSPAKPANAMVLGSYGGTAEIHSKNISVTCCESYNWNMGAYANPGGGFSTNYLFQYNNFHDNSHCGLGLDIIGVSVLNNNFTNNNIGVEAFRDNTVVHWNNFCGNAVAIDFNTTVYGATSLNAINNYWCSASGPSHNPGCGDPVSDYVLFDPWLLEPVIPGEEPTTYDKTLALKDGWTLVSTDGWINSANSTWVGKILAYTHTISEGYVEAELADLVPVDAMYVKTDGCGGIGIIYSGGVPAASVKELEAGWNLISSATHAEGHNPYGEGNARAVLSPLRYIDVGAVQGIGLTTLVSQGEYNQHTENFYLATLTPSDWGDGGLDGHGGGLRMVVLNPFDGYWVYMNADKSFGVIPY